MIVKICFKTEEVTVDIRYDTRYHLSIKDRLSSFKFTIVFVGKPISQ